jgi:hypothetical protein
LMLFSVLKTGLPYHLSSFIGKQQNGALRFCSTRVCANKNVRKQVGFSKSILELVDFFKAQYIDVVRMKRVRISQQKS